MGMSASQARLISLTARMSDTEYEGQQINQQRQVIANKMNDVYNKAMEMDVPIAPSKIDYSITAASGKHRGKPVTLRVGDDGTLKLTKRTSGQVLQTTGSAHIGTTVDAKFDTATRPTKATSKKTLYKHRSYNAKEIVDLLNNKKITEEQVHGVAFNDAHGIQYSNTDGKYDLGKLNDGEEYNITISGYDVESNFVEVSGDGADLSECFIKSENGYEIADENNTKEQAAYTESEASNYYVYDGGTFRQATVDDLNNDSTQLFKRNDASGAKDGKLVSSNNGSLIDGRTACDFASLESQAASDQPAGLKAEFNDLKSALENYYATSMDKSFEDDKANWCFTIEGTTIRAYHEAASNITSDRTGAPIEEFQAEFSKDVEVAEDIVNDQNHVKYDENGNVTEVVVEGEWVKLTADSGVYDNVAYDEAMRQYERAKVEYDYQQNQFNKQTSIYQRQDKQLELKLTRLDNERNALNTEIESVKKVIQDAIDKGFKTFSG